LKARPLDVLADASKNLAVVHRILKNMIQKMLPPNILSGTVSMFNGGAGRHGLTAKIESVGFRN
jgi:hypothetical protein